MTEDPLALAQRHVLEGERRVAEQIDRIERMKADGDPSELSQSARQCSRPCGALWNSPESIWHLKGALSASGMTDGLSRPYFLAHDAG